MRRMRTWLGRTVAVSAVAVLATMALAPIGANASPDLAPAADELLEAQPAGDVGVQHVGETWFTGFGCTFYGRSGPAANGRHFAVTAVASGSGCPRVMVRAYVCGGGSCYTTNWRVGSQAEYWAPAGHRIITSYHKCEPCTLTNRINH